MTVNSQNSKIQTFERVGLKNLKFSYKIVSKQVCTWEFFQFFFTYLGWGGRGGLEGLKISKIRKKIRRTPRWIFFYQKVDLFLRYIFFFQTLKEGCNMVKKNKNYRKTCFLTFLFFFAILLLSRPMFWNTFWNKPELLFLIIGPQSNDDSVATLLNFYNGSTTAYSTFPTTKW